MKKLLSVLILFVLLFGVSAVSEDDWLTFSEDPNNLAGEWFDTVSERATLSVFYDEFAENGNPQAVNSTLVGTYITPSEHAIAAAAKIAISPAGSTYFMANVAIQRHAMNRTIAMR